MSDEGDEFDGEMDLSTAAGVGRLRPSGLEECNEEDKPNRVASGVVSGR